MVDGCVDGKIKLDWRADIWGMGRWAGVGDAGCKQIGK